MAEYFYDGTFEGFLCCVYAHYYKEKATAIFLRGGLQQMTFLDTAIEIETDAKQADVVYRAIEKKISAFDLERAYRIFLADDPQKEMILLNYLRLGFLKGSSISQYHGSEIVRAAEKLEKKVTFEAHRLMGLLRFSVLEDEILYAELAPDHNILTLIAPHFSDRYKNNPFIIHDLRRSKAVIAAGGHWYLSEFMKKELTKEYHRKEMEYRKLWKKYFENIAIKERTNLRCQKNFMPVRYWEHLTEMKEETEE